MRLTNSPRFEQFGSVQIHEIQRVIELDAGSGSSTSSSLVVSPERLLQIESDMAIVILCMNEEFKTIESVLSGVPHDCLIILVSNSSRGPVDRYQTEVNLLEAYCRDADRSAVVIHQKDPGAAQAFSSSGAAEMIGSDGLIHNGKGEGMLMGMVLAALTKRAYIGFIDADNYIPGSVHEYCKAYAAGLHLAGTQDAMVRISWNSKPKERNGRLMFDRKGRSSKIVNDWLNNLLQHLTGYGTEIVKTGNAGEHCMTMSLGMKLQLAGGFAVEPYEYIFMLEKLSGLLDHDDETPRARSPSQISEIHIRQIETRNPHLHDNKGDEHVSNMFAAGLHPLYHSEIAPRVMKNALRDWMVEKSVLEADRVPPRGRLYPSVESLDLINLCEILTTQATSLDILTGPLGGDWPLDFHATD